MAYDEQLAHQIRESLQDVDGVAEKRMFGGLAFLVNGRMAVAAGSGGALMVRVDPKQLDALLTRPHVDPMVMRGKELRGWLLVGQEGLDSDEELAAWVDQGVAFARTLPEK